MSDRDLDFAREWARTAAQLATTAAKRDALTKECDTLRSTVDDLGKTLRDTLGAQIPQRFFDLGDGRVVMVSVTRGVELVQMERAGKEPADG